MSPLPTVEQTVNHTRNILRQMHFKPLSLIRYSSFTLELYLSLLTFKAVLTCNSQNLINKSSKSDFWCQTIVSQSNFIWAHHIYWCNKCRCPTFLLFQWKGCFDMNVQSCGPLLKAQRWLQSLKWFGLWSAAVLASREICVMNHSVLQIAVIYLFF